MESAELDHEQLRVYAVALEFLELATTVARKLPRQKGQAGDQLQRASESVVLRIAEGAGLDRGGAEQHRHFRAARASALECAAVLDVARIRGVLSPQGRDQGRALVVRVVQMLSRLAPRR